MTTIDLGPPAAEPVTLADIKTWCRVERNDEDELIAGLIRAARGAIEAQTGLVLARRAFRLLVDPVPRDGRIEMSRRPLRLVSGVSAFDAAGTEHEFGPEGAAIERGSGREAIRLLPEVRDVAANGAEIEFEAGFDAGEAPEDLLVALRQIVANCYEIRGAVSLDQQPGMVPPQARALIAPYRRIQL